MPRAHRNLLIVRAGDCSLHPGWLASEGDQRSWDLHISYYGSHPEPFGALPEGVTLSWEQGGKYLGLAACFAKYPDFLSSYDFIGLPDDDLQLTNGSWSRVFATMAATGAVVGQPSLDHRSFFSHAVTLTVDRFDYREVNFVEVMMPVFDTRFLRRVIPEFTATASSWGLDFIYCDMALKDRATMIVDDRNSLLHTRKVGAGRLYSGLKGPFEDLRRVHEERGIAKLCNSLVGVRPDGKRVVLRTPDRIPSQARKFTKMKQAMGVKVINI